jgi:hypothetical protein
VPHSAPDDDKTKKISEDKTKRKAGDGKPKKAKGRKRKFNAAMHKPLPQSCDTPRGGQQPRSMRGTCMEMQSSDLSAGQTVKPAPRWTACGITASAATPAASRSELDGSDATPYPHSTVETEEDEEIKVIAILPR